MVALSDSDLLALWEGGRREGPVRRAFSLLRAARPEQTADALAALPVGARDAALLDLHAEAFGGRIERVVDCPTCGEQVELACTAADLRLPEPTAPGGRVVHDGWEVEFRLPDTRDLLAIADAPDVASGRARLLGRCVTRVTRDGVPAAELPEAVAGAVAEAMAAADPGAEVLLRLACPACEATWDQLLDVVPVLWHAVARRARDLLWEVHTLASTYHWPEGAILAMSRERRATYLDLVRG